MRSWPLVLSVGGDWTDSPATFTKPDLSKPLGPPRTGTQNYLVTIFEEAPLLPQFKADRVLPSSGRLQETAEADWVWR